MNTLGFLFRQDLSYIFVVLYDCKMYVCQSSPTLFKLLSIVHTSIKCCESSIKLLHFYLLLISHLSSVGKVHFLILMGGLSTKVSVSFQRNILSAALLLHIHVGVSGNSRAWTPVRAPVGRLQISADAQCLHEGVPADGVSSFA